MSSVVSLRASALFVRGAGAAAHLLSMTNSVFMAAVFMVFVTHTVAVPVAISQLDNHILLLNLSRLEANRCLALLLDS